MLIQELTKKELINPPKWLPDNVIYLVNTGSVMYGCSTNDSDKDVTGIVIPLKTDVFPHLRGEIVGFGRHCQRFEQWQQHHILDSSTKKSYDLTIYSIIQYFQLAMIGNPNTLELMFAPRDCVLHTSEIGELLRDNRKLFLHKGTFHKHKGYCWQQLKRSQSQEKTGKRKETVEEFGFDPKAVYHVYRLIDQCDQILSTGDLDLRRISEQLKFIRQGNISIEEVQAYYTEKEKFLTKLYETSDIVPYAPDEEKIKALLVKCLELHYQKLGEDCLRLETKAETALSEIRRILERY
jgi:predicted nucleotidyltransferase